MHNSFNDKSVNYSDKMRTNTRIYKLMSVDVNPLVEEDAPASGRVSFVLLAVVTVTGVINVVVVRGFGVANKSVCSSEI